MFQKDDVGKKGISTMLTLIKSAGIYFLIGIVLIAIGSFGRYLWGLYYHGKTYVGPGIHPGSPVGFLIFLMQFGGICCAMIGVWRFGNSLTIFRRWGAIISLLICISFSYWLWADPGSWSSLSGKMEIVKFAIWWILGILAINNIKLLIKGGPKINQEMKIEKEEEPLREDAEEISKANLEARKEESLRSQKTIDTKRAIPKKIKIYYTLCRLIGGIFVVIGMFFSAIIIFTVLDKGKLVTMFVFIPSLFASILIAFLAFRRAKKLKSYLAYIME